MGEAARSFHNMFKFDPKRTLHLGVERECFIVDRNGVIVPQAQRVLQSLAPIDVKKRFGYELSACQIEDRAGPCPLDHLDNALLDGDVLLQDALEHLPLGVSYREVAPKDMSLAVFPDPTGRYQEITKTMPKRTLQAACRVIGTHVHVGMPDHETAISVHDKIVPSCKHLMRIGDNSNGKRLRVYAEVVGQCMPVAYGSWHNFYQTALDDGFDQDPRRCWTLIRISPHGTIEFRMFGATADRARVMSWARACHTLCAEAMP